MRVALTPWKALKHTHIYYKYISSFATCFLSPLLCVTTLFASAYERMCIMFGTSDIYRCYAMKEFYSFSLSSDSIQWILSLNYCRSFGGGGVKARDHFWHLSAICKQGWLMNGLSNDSTCVCSTIHENL